MEKLCFRQFPSPSAKYPERVAVWCGDARRLSSPHSSEGVPMRRIRNLEQTDLPRSPSSPQDLHSLAAKEERCARILRNIYPSTLTGMKFPKSVARSEAAADCLARPRPSRRQTVDLQIQKKEVMQFDTAAASPLGANAIRLIQGAAETRHNYRAIRKRALAEQNCVKSGIKVKKLDLRAQIAALHTVRNVMLEKFPCMQDAFNSIDLHQHGYLEKRDLCYAFERAQFCTLGEARVIFDLMNGDNDGVLMTPKKFHAGIEIIAPVTTVEGLRKRLICLGFQSMTQAIDVMNGGDMNSIQQPLSQQEFAKALRRVWVIESQEHLAVFNAVRDHADPKGCTSLDELACALAVVSPCLALEEFRRLVIKEYGSLEQGLPILCPKGDIEMEEFKQITCSTFGMTEYQAEIIFNLIDLDLGGDVSRDEIKRALVLAEGSLDMEDCRDKLRQGYRTVETAWHESYARPTKEEGLPDENEIHFRVDEFAAVLRPLNLGDHIVERLLSLMAVSEQGVSGPEFWRSARLFAPSCVLDELKMELLQKYGTLEEAFHSIQDRRAFLDRKAFKQLLESLDVGRDSSTFRPDNMFDFMDVWQSGATTVSQLLSALQCLQPGVRKVLSPSERKTKAEANATKIFQPALRLASELKESVKELVTHSTGTAELQSGEHSPSEEGMDFEIESLASPTESASPANMGAGSPMNVMSTGSLLTGTATQSLRQAKSLRSRVSTSVPKNVLARRTFQKITSSLQVLPPSVEDKNVHEFVRYFGSADNLLKEQSPCVQKTPNLVEERRHFENLRREADPS